MATIRFPPNQYFTMKPHVQKFADDMEAYFGGAMNWGTYGGHSPPEGPTQALDHFNPNSPAGHAQQDKAAAWAIKNAKKYGLRYVIKRYEIWNIERAGEGWRKRRVTGNQTNDHLDHNHYTFYATAEIELPDPTPLPNLQEETMFLYSTHKTIDQGSYWLVVAGIAFRMHRPDDVTRLQSKGVPDFGEMTESFHNVFEHRG